MAKQTKIEALLAQVNSGKLDTDKAKILHYIKYNTNCSEIDLVNALGMLNKTVSARLSDLEDMGLIRVAGTVVQRGYNRSTYQYIYANELRDILAKNRDLDKFMVWLNKGVKSYEQYLPNSIYQDLKAFNNRLKSQQN